MPEDIFARMTADTRNLVKLMQSQATSSSPDADLVQLARQGYRDIIPLAGAIEEVAKVENYQTSSTPAIDLRLYRPQVSVETLLPAIVYFHGGGFISGDFDK
ncbi:hypothetical protein [Pleurocapsa sp. PCC 7319]|uniref:hypothetical protein n=1 Tax=Pleurocapsa sp. PCC 7319 TaxID=118161 RepID=UPI0003678268|nr:hypothetical protein [Pleurocapsa sp. PCC 7319]